MLNHGAIAWASKKQPVIAQSTTESELIAANEASREASWLRRFMNSVGLTQKERTMIFCNNQSTIHFIKNPTNHRRSKHIEIQFLYIIERIGIKEVQISYVNTRHQIANILTKGVPRDTT